MRLVVSSIRVLLVGLALGVGMVVLRGAPELDQPAGLCTGDEGATPDESHFTWVTQAEAAWLLPSTDVVFVDARDRETFEQGHIAGALSLPEGEMRSSEELALLATARIVIAYCDTSEGCNASTVLANELVAASLHDVRVLEGGMPAWLENDYPAEAGLCRLCP